MLETYRTIEPLSMKCFVLMAVSNWLLALAPNHSPQRDAREKGGGGLIANSHKSGTGTKPKDIGDGNRRQQGGVAWGIGCNGLSRNGFCRATRGGFPSPRVHIEGLGAKRPGSAVWDEGLHCRNMEAKKTVSGQAIAQEKTPASGGMDARVGDNVEEILIFRLISLS